VSSEFPGVYQFHVARQISDIIPADSPPESKMAVSSIQMQAGWLVCLNRMSTRCRTCLSRYRIQQLSGCNLLP